jgi:beta-galactosidase
VGVSLTDRGLRIGDEDVPVYSGSVHYWRLERDRWPMILDRVVELGFRMIETYIPWSIHEIAPGEYDWGQIDPRKDIEGFMRLCEERGIWLQVRPGPLINAELTYFGFPEWVVLDPAVQAKSASGSLHIDSAWGLHPPHQYPVPSYASEAFYGHIATWFDAICPVLARHLAPQGCIVTCQSDNETCYFFHDQAYATDYCDDSIALYRTFLSDQYGADIAALNAVYGTTYADFGTVEPPRDCTVWSKADLPWHLDWVAYKEYQIVWAVSRIARMFRDRGIDSIPIFHDIAFQEETPLDLALMEADPEIDWVGMNMYCNKEQYRTVAKRIRFLNGSSRLSYVPEFGCGLWSHHHQTFEPNEHEFVTLSALMHGLKALNYYMLVERERWQASPITRHGEFRPDYMPFYLDLGAFLERYPLPEFKRDNSRLLLFNFDIGRHLAALSTLHVAHVDLLGLPPALGEVHVDLGLEWDPRVEEALEREDSWLGTVGRHLSRSALDFDYADTHIRSDRLALYETVYVQSTDFLAEVAQRRLRDYVENGGRVVIGPGLPTLDPALNPCRVLVGDISAPGRYVIGAGELIWAGIPDLAATIDAIESQAAIRLHSGEMPLIVQTRGDQTLIFVANPTAVAQSDCMVVGERNQLTPIWPPGGGQEINESVSISVPSYSVRIWEVRPADAEEGVAR